MEHTFQPWPKLPRLNREVVVTEKIDGTNACIVIEELAGGIYIGAQSRTRNITPDSDNYGFATWVDANASTLIADLGPGHHFGEWWGAGIQRGYGLDHRRFSLFNSHRWRRQEFTTPNVHVVPVIWCGGFEWLPQHDLRAELADNGSHAAPGFMRPEGFVVYHVAANQMFKVLLENDHLPKGA